MTISLKEIEKQLRKEQTNSTSGKINIEELKERAKDFNSGKINIEELKKRAENQNTLKEMDNLKKKPIVLSELRNERPKPFLPYYKPVRLSELEKESAPKEMTWGNAIVEGFKSGNEGMSLNKEYFKMSQGKPNNAEKLENTYNDKYNYETDSGFKKAVHGAMQMLGQQYNNITDPRTIGLMGTYGAGVAVLGNVGPQALVPEEIITIPAALGAGYMTGSTLNAYEAEAGSAYKEMINYGVSEETARNVSTIIGAGNAALEMAQVDELIKGFKLAEKIGAKQTKGIIKKILVDKGFDIVKETAQEVVQEGVTIAGSNYARSREGLETDSLHDVGKRLGDTAASSALSFGVLNVPSTAKNIVDVKTMKPTLPNLKTPSLPELKKNTPSLPNMNKPIENKAPSLPNINKQTTPLPIINNKTPMLPNMVNKPTPLPIMENKVPFLPNMANKTPSLPIIEKQIPMLPNMRKPISLSETEASLLQNTIHNNTINDMGGVISQENIKTPLKPIFEPYNNQFKDLGADTYNPNTFENKVTEYGAIKPGENPNRVIDIPIQTNDDTKINRGVRTTLEAQITPDENIADFENYIMDNKFDYEVVSDKKAESYADNFINLNGWEQSLAEFKAAANGKKEMTKEMVAVGQTLYNNAINNKDVKSALDIAVDLAQSATKAGQVIQAQRMMKKFTPSGQLYALQKSVRKMNQELLEKYKSKYKGIEIDKTLATDLLNAKTQEETDIAIEKIKQNIVDQTPSTWVDKWNSWLYISMLANPKTHIRNVIGNAVFVPVRQFKNVIGAALEKTLPQADRTKSILTPKNKDLVAFAIEDFKSNKKSISGEGKYSLAYMGFDVESRRKVYKIKFIEWLRKTNFDLLEKEDAFFLKNAYTSSFAQAMKAKGVTIDYLNSGSKESQQVLNSIREYATFEAKKATYRDDSKLAEELNKLKNLNTGTKIIGGGTIPFTKTPINIIKRGGEYSPLGFIKGAKEMALDVKNGTKTPSQALDSFASGLSGTGIVMLGLWLASKGLLIGGGSEDKKERSSESTQGIQNYALEIGDYTYTIDWGAPSVLPLFVGVELYNSFKDGNASYDDVINGISRISEPIFELSMMQGVNNLLQTAGYSNQPIADIAINATASYLGQAVPTLFGQVARSIDNTDRTTYIDKNKNTPKPLQNLTQKAQSKIPILNWGLEPRLDNWGRENKKETLGDYAVNAFENFLSPGYLEKINTTEVDKELKRIYDKIGTNVYPSTPNKYFRHDNKTINLTAEEYTKYKEIRGQKSFELINQMITTQNYKSLDDKEKAKAIQNTYDYANDVAKKKVKNIELTGINKDLYDIDRSGTNITYYIISREVPMLLNIPRLPKYN